jgi:cytochrome c biogenesis factor
MVDYFNNAIIFFSMITLFFVVILFFMDLQAKSKELTINEAKSYFKSHTVAFGLILIAFGILFWCKVMSKYITQVIAGSSQTLKFFEITFFNSSFYFYSFTGLLMLIFGLVIVRFGFVHRKKQGKYQAKT